VRSSLVPVPGLGQTDRLARHLALRERAASRDGLHGAAVMVPRGGVHPWVDAGGILAQGLLDRAHALHELAPVHRIEDAQAADAVADGNLVGRLLLVLRMHQLLDGQIGLEKSLLEPSEGQGQAESLQSQRKLGDERTGHGRVGPRHVRSHQDQALRIFLGHRRHLLGPDGGSVALDARGGDPRTHTPQVLDESQAQHDGNGPQFA
jgi:hypothetical protein